MTAVLAERYCPLPVMVPRTPASDHPFAVITGASRGIGAAYARALAQRGYDLLLVSRDRDRLERLAHELMPRAKVEIEILDLSQPEAGRRLYASARQRREAVDLVVHNAGFGAYGPFAAMPLPLVHQMLRLQVSTVLETMRLFLPDMIHRRQGAMITVASVVGLLPTPYLAEYAACKAFLVHFCRALAQEVRGDGVTIQVCCPGSTDTDFHATAGFYSRNPFGMRTADEVAATSLKALGRGKTVVTVGWEGAWLAALSRIIPPNWMARGAAWWLRPK